MAVALDETEVVPGITNGAQASLLEASHFAFALYKEALLHSYYASYHRWREGHCFSYPAAFVWTALSFSLNGLPLTSAIPLMQASSAPEIDTGAYKVVPPSLGLLLPPLWAVSRAIANISRPSLPHLDRQSRDDAAID
jgi:hypothetical protein